MDYLVYRGYNALAAQRQRKTFIESTEFRNCVVLGAVSADADGLSRRLVTVEVYKDNEVFLTRKQWWLLFDQRGKFC